MSEEYVRIRIEVGKPKRRSGVYPKRLEWGIHSASRRRQDGVVVRVNVFQLYQLNEGPNLFEGAKFRLIPV